MRLHRRPIASHQRARLIAWTLAMLVWLAGVLMGEVFTPRHERQRAGRMSLAYLKQRVKMLLISRAIDFLPHLWHRSSAKAWRAKPGQIRAVTGARICRLLKHDEVLECVRALVDVLLNIDTHAKSIARRMKRGLSRRAPFGRAPVRDEEIRVLAAQAAVSFDSS